MKIPVLELFPVKSSLAAWAWAVVFPCLLALLLPAPAWAGVWHHSPRWQRSRRKFTTGGSGL